MVIDTGSVLHRRFRRRAAGDVPDPLDSARGLVAAAPLAALLWALFLISVL